MTSPKRALAALALGALALPVLSVAPTALADGAATPPVPRGVGAFCAGVPDAGFSDVASDSTFRSDINCIAAAEITRGLQGGDQYGPALPVSRAQMASFIARMLDTADRLDQVGAVRALPPANGASPFTDVAGDDTHRASIDRLAAVGIVQGGPAGLSAAQYGPTLNVSRAQMASFVIRSLEYALATDLSTGEDYFTDDGNAVPHVDNINTIASLAIAVGDGKSSYTPAGLTSRGQMAAFIARSLSYLESRQLIRPLLAPPTNQSFVVTPAVAETLTLGGDAASRTRTYSVRTSAAGVVHQIQLVPSQNVNLGADGAVTFADVDDDGAADIGSAAARVTSVNNVVVSGTTSTRATAVPVAGTITFTVQGEGLESVVPVVFFDADDDGALDLDAGNAPVAAELFGVGGATTFVNPAAVNQLIPTSSPQRVVRVNRDANQFDLASSTFTYDDNDLFSIAASESADALPATIEEFRAALSRGDLISGTYTTTTSLSSTFRLIDAAPVAPAAVTAEAGTGQNTDDISIAIHLAPSADVDGVLIQRAVVSAGSAGTGTGTIGDYATVADIAPSSAQRSSGIVTHVDGNVPAGLYRYRAATVTDGQRSAFTVDPENVASVAVDNTAPTLIATSLLTDVGIVGALDAGDVFTLRASEALRAPAGGNFFRIRDADGTIVDVVCGGAGNSTCALNREDIPATPSGPNAGAPAGSVVTVILMDAPALVMPGSMPDLQYSGTLIAISGITDLAGNSLAVNSGDLTIDGLR